MKEQDANIEDSLEQYLNRLLCKWPGNNGQLTADMLPVGTKVWTTWEKCMGVVLPLGPTDLDTYNYVKQHIKMNQIVRVRFDTESGPDVYMVNTWILRVIPERFERVVGDYLRNRRMWDLLRLPSAKLGYARGKYPDLYAELDVPEELDLHVPAIDHENIDCLGNFM